MNDLVGSMNLVRIIDLKSVLSAIGNVLSELFKKNTIFENYRLHYLSAIIKLWSKVLFCHFLILGAFVSTEIKPVLKWIKPITRQAASNFQTWLKMSNINNVKFKLKRMIKKSTKMMLMVFASAMLLTSCYSYTSVVGAGAKGSTQSTKWNHYVLFGLAPVGVSDSKQMADGANDYTVHTRQSFVNGLISGLTFGIYSPTTTTVTK